MKTYYLILATCLSASFAFPMERQESLTLYDAITYATYTTSLFPVRAHVVTIPLESVNVALVPAMGQRENVASIAQRVNANIAINGSNYRRGGNYNGNRVNLLYLDGKIYSDLQLVRGAFCWKSATRTPIIDTISLDIKLTVNDVPLPVTAINQPRIAGQGVLYTDVADISLLAYTPGCILMINKDKIVTSISTEIPRTISDGWLLYQGDGANLIGIKPGMVAECSFNLCSVETQESYNDVDFILAGAGLLLKNGSVVVDNLYQELSQGTAVVHCGDEIVADFITKEMQEWLIELRHPRTALGITVHNEICIVVVDGRQEHSEGMNLKELALFMQQLGCTDALNMGGGGCTTLCISNKLMNSPSTCFFGTAKLFGQERPVSEALCFFCR